MKRILSLVLGLVVIMSSFSMTAFSANEDTTSQVKPDAAKDAYARLSAVGVTLEGNNLTAGDYIASLMQFSNSNAGNNDHTFELAKGMGLIDSAVERTMPINYKDALSAALMFAGYKQMLEMQDVMSVASSEDLPDSITAGDADNLTKDAAAVLLSNLLDVRVMEYNGKSYNRDGTTVLEKYFNMTQKRVDIIRADKKDNKIYVRENGNTVVYYGAETLDFDTVSGGVHLVFINDENAVCYIKTTGKGFVFWDFVYTVNKNTDQSINYYIDQLEKLTFYNSKEEYKVSDDVIAFYADEAAENRAYPVCGAFVKVLGYGNEITQISIYSLTEGGLLKSFTGIRLSYVQGTINDLVSGDIASVQDITVIIDGREKTLDDLKKNMVFDYWSNADETSMIIVASSRKAVGDLKSYGSDTAKIGDLYYNVSSNVYSYSRYMERYAAGFLLRPPVYVEAYIDDRCEIRYVKDVPEYDTEKTIYGIVKKAWIDENSEDRGIKIIPITGPGSGSEVVEHKVKNVLSKGSVSFEYVMSVESNLDGEGFFKFTVNENDEVSKIETVENMTNRISINFNNNSKEALSYGGFYLNDATMIIIYQIDGDMKVKTMSWSKLWDNYQKGSPQIYLRVDYHPTENPIPRFGLVTGDVHMIGPGWNSGGFVTSIKYTENGDYNVVMGGTTYTLDAETVAKYGIKKDVFAQFRVRPFTKNGMIYDEANGSKVIDFSGPISSWNDVLKEKYGSYSINANSGLYMGKVILKGDKYIQFEVDGQPTAVYPVTSGLRVSEIVDAKTRIYRDAPTDINNAQWFQGSQALRNVRIGDNVMFSIENKDSFVSVVRIYYINDGSVFTPR